MSLTFDLLTMHAAAPLLRLPSLYSCQKWLACAVATAWLALAGVAHATCPSTAGRFVAKGLEVTDSQTGLVWQRCSVGQSWNGSTCTGNASSYTYEGALAYAKIQNTTDSVTGWRLPNVKELASLADKGCQNPAIDRTAFPATPSSWYWTSSTYAGNSQLAWAVDFLNGYFGYNYGRGNYLRVRLVRASQ